MERIRHSIRVFMSSGIVFFSLAVFLYAIDLVPERQTAVADQVVDDVQKEGLIQQTPDVTPVSKPTRVIIESIGVDTVVLTPEVADLEVLDTALLSGAVQYPGSPDAGEEGNMLIFGHSSYLPVVKNKAFQAFNKLGTLKPGEEIVVLSDEYRYRYEVKSVRLSRAEDTVIDFTAREPMLTIATCNTFGQKQERWVVTATLVTFESYRTQ